MSTFANSEDPDEMQHNASSKRIQYFLKITTRQWTIPSLLYQSEGGIH